MFKMKHVMSVLMKSYYEKVTNVHVKDTADYFKLNT